MKREAADTSVVVAALLGWHEHHKAARQTLDRGLTSGRLILPAPALMESYSVMTRLPSPHRIGVSDAVALLQETFQHVPVITLEAEDHWSLLHRLEEKGIAGGRAYDGHILACARKGKCGCLYTFNEKDFLALDEPDIEIVRPSQA
jgi:predicted nucleic acid-binding protein